MSVSMDIEVSMENPNTCTASRSYRCNLSLHFTIGIC